MSDEPMMIMCPPLKDYPKQPDDHSKSRLIKCPECKKKCWLSIKKEEIIEACEQAEKEVILLCYPCLMRWAIKARESGEINQFTDFIKVQL